MKRMLLVTLLIAALLLPSIALCEDAVETLFDTALKYHLPYHPALVIDPLAVELNMESVPVDEQYQMQILGAMLVDLYAYETGVEGKKVEESMAVELYRLLQKEAGIVCMTAVNEDAVLVNGLFAVNNGGKSSFASMYWFEYNLEENTLRLAYDFTIEKCAKAEDFLSEYTFANYVLNSVGGNPFMSSRMPEDSVFCFQDGEHMMSFFDAIYEEVYDALPTF